MDTVDARKTKEWFDNLDKELKGRVPDYLIVSHLELIIPKILIYLQKKYKRSKNLFLSAKAKSDASSIF